MNEMKERHAAIRARLYADAEAFDATHYCAIVRVDGPFGHMVSNCQHRHRTREAAEKCAEKCADIISDPRAGYPTTQWRA